MAKANKKTQVGKSDALLLDALGRLPQEEKQFFIPIAEKLLQRTAAVVENRKWTPTKKHYELLADLNDKCRALDLALERVGRNIPEAYMREAWEVAVNMREAHGAPFPMELPTTLRDLALSARLCLPDKNPKHRPEEHTVEDYVVKTLAAEFRSAFCKPPTFGSNSPFVKFCNEALPMYGFIAPSLPKLKKIVQE